MIAALPQYLWPETAAATDALWVQVRDRLREAGREAPEGLGPSDGHDEPGADVVLTQLCNLPWRRRREGSRLVSIGTWNAGLPDMAPGTYRSVFVVRRGAASDPAAHLSEPFAINGWSSHSGWGAPWGWARERSLTIAAPYRTGSHRESARHVAEGRAAMACLDAISLDLLDEHEPETAGALERIGVTRASPGQTFATTRHPGTMRAILTDAIEAIGPEARRTLRLAGAARMTGAAYADLPDPPGPLHPAAAPR